jgi:putative FmdB family regulatory protein
MPTYVYRREDGTTFEIKQRITEDPLEECPETGQDVERIITGNAGLIFKGDGFYVNDYGNDSNGRSGSGSDDGAGKEASSTGDASTGGEANDDAS